MKKKFLSILLCSGLLLNFTGCNNSQKSNQSEDISVADIDDTIISLEEPTDLPFDNSKPEYVVAYFVNKLATIDIDNLENLDTSDIILPSKFVSSMAHSYNDISYITEKLTEDIKNAGVDSYSYNNFIIKLISTPNSTKNIYEYLVICDIEESKFMLQIGITDADEENNHFVGYYEKNDERQLNLLISKTKIRSWEGETTGGTKADLIQKWEDEGSIVKVSLDEFM